VTPEQWNKFEALLGEYADLYRRTRTAHGYIDLNLDQVVVYAVQDMRNSLKRSSMPLEQLTDEVAFQKECLANTEARTKTLPSVESTLPS
jgi:hypothetical protein